MQRRHLAIALAIAAATACGIAAPSGARARARAQASDPAAIAALVEKLRQAMLSRDMAVLDDLLADELTYGHSDRRVQTKAEFVDAVVTGKSAFNAITISEQTIRIVGDVAIVRHRFEGDTVSNGKPGHPDIRIVQVWQKRGDGWKLLVRQAH
jgi:ketosteroid isomerase-like protein